MRTGKTLLRFIPTVVGNTRRRVVGGGDVTVHPHGRGEHEVALFIAQRVHGSSPRSWGTLLFIS